MSVNCAEFFFCEAVFGISCSLYMDILVAVSSEENILFPQVSQRRNPSDELSRSGDKLKGGPPDLRSPTCSLRPHLKFWIHYLQSAIHYLLIEIHRITTQHNDTMIVRNELPSGRLVVADRGLAFNVICVISPC